MAKQSMVSLDLNKNQILNVALQNLATPPANPVSGQIYFNTQDDVPYIWDGSAWLNLSEGSVTSVTAGQGLVPGSGSSASDPILDVNVDNVTLEINADTVRIKDLGVSAAKLANNAVTTAKILNSNVTTIKLADDAVTFAKIQDVASMTVLGRVTGGVGDVAALGLISDLNQASSSTLATSQAIVDYIGDALSAIGSLVGAFNASTSTNFPSAPGGTKKGDYWYVSTAGTVQGVALNVGDVLIASADAASISDPNDWIFIETNRDQATDSVLGVVRLATQAEVNTGVNQVAVITPYTLSQRLATESRTGLSQIATQAEVNAGVIDNYKFVTPLKLKNFVTDFAQNNGLIGFAINIGDGTNTSHQIAHNLNTLDVLVDVVLIATGESVIADWTRDNANQITVTFAQPPTVNQFRVLVSKI